MKCVVILSVTVMLPGSNALDTQLDLFSVCILYDTIMVFLNQLFFFSFYKR